MEVGDLVKIKKANPPTLGIIIKWEAYIRMFAVWVDKGYCMSFYEHELEVINEERNKSKGGMGQHNRNIKGS